MAACDWGPPVWWDIALGHMRLVLGCLRLQSVLSLVLQKGRHEKTDSIALGLDSRTAMPSNVCVHLA